MYLNGKYVIVHYSVMHGFSRAVRHVWRVLEKSHSLSTNKSRLHLYDRQFIHLGIDHSSLSNLTYFVTYSA